MEHLGDRGRALVVKCVPEEVTGIVTSNPDQATKVSHLVVITICVGPWGIVEPRACMCWKFAVEEG